MNTQKQTPCEHHQVLIIGAGVCGIYMLHKMLSMGLDAKVLEAGTEPGGTWYWNRYPGARFDSESYTYGYAFDKEILEAWDWKEHFSAQPDTLEYLNFVVDKLALRDDMILDTKIASAQFDEQKNQWQITTTEGKHYSCQFLLTAIGMLSAPTMPKISGVEDFKGQSFHTYHWPQEKVDLSGKKVAVIGTGATGVQVISEIASQVGELTVFQRRPNWCAPLHNSRISKSEMATIKASYDDIFAQCATTPGSFLHGPDPRSFYDLSEAERHEFWQALYDKPGFGVWLSNFRECLLEEEANAEYSAWIANKIRQRVTDQALADKLIPKDHGFGTRRVPLETRYYEAYNLPHVSLVDINETPIEKITDGGIQTTQQNYDFDIIIYATGFDAITGAFDRIEFVGREGQTLFEKWRDGPITYLGLGCHGFPNLITLAGPQGASVSSNFPPNIATGVEWTAELIKHLVDAGISTIEPNAEAEAAWFDEIKRSYKGALLTQTPSWFTGYNSNVPGHDKLRHMIYVNGAPKYRERLEAVAADQYQGFDMKA